MERSGIMSTSAYTQQLEKINQILQEEISLLKTLPKNEAKVLARKNLSELGLVGTKSNYCAPIAQKGQPFCLRGINRLGKLSESDEQQLSNHTTIGICFLYLMYFYNNHKTIILPFYKQNTPHNNSCNQCPLYILLCH